MSEDDWRSISGRTYLMGTRAKAVMDNLSVMLPGISKSQILNVALFYTANSIRERRGDNHDVPVRKAFDEIVDELTEVGYKDLLTSVLPFSSKNQTRLDNFLGSKIDVDLDAEGFDPLESAEYETDYETASRDGMEMDGNDENVGEEGGSE